MRDLLPAAISSLDPVLYEAATVDGATRWQRSPAHSAFTQAHGWRGISAVDHGALRMFDQVYPA